MCDPIEAKPIPVKCVGYIASPNVVIHTLSQYIGHALCHELEILVSEMAA
jgi:hypothetical protein